MSKYNWRTVSLKDEKYFLNEVRRYLYPDMSEKNWIDICALFNTIDWQRGQNYILLNQAMAILQATEPNQVLQISKNSRGELLSYFNNDNKHQIQIQPYYQPIIHENMNLLRDARELYFYISKLLLETQNPNEPVKTVYEPQEIHDYILDQKIKESKSGFVQYQEPSMSSLLVANLARVYLKEGRLCFSIYPQQFDPGKSAAEWFDALLTSYEKLELRIENLQSKRLSGSPESKPIFSSVEVQKYFQTIQLSEVISEPFVFVIMPFSKMDVDQKYYSRVIKPLIETKFKMGCYRSDEEKKSVKVDNKIFTMIKKSRLVIADITNNNPNVMYELGLAHALNVDVVLITNKEPKNMPFDISHVHAELYLDQNQLENNLREQLKHYGLKEQH